LTGDHGIVVGQHDDIRRGACWQGLHLIGRETLTHGIGSRREAAKVKQSIGGRNETRLTGVERLVVVEVEIDRLTSQRRTAAVALIPAFPPAALSNEFNPVD